jgi:hypothetical protein
VRLNSAEEAPKQNSSQTHAAKMRDLLYSVRKIAVHLFETQAVQVLLFPKIETIPTLANRSSGEVLVVTVDLAPIDLAGAFYLVENVWRSS